MKLRFDRPVTWLVIFIVLVLINVGASQILKWQEETRMSTMASEGASGLSIFNALKNKLKANSSHITRRPFLGAQQLDDYDSLFILGPRKPLSLREAKIIAEAVRKGLYLVVSFHNEVTQANLLPLLSATNVKLPPFTKDPDFKNGEPVLVTGSHNEGPFSEQEKYAFYSDRKLETGDTFCMLEKRYCYWREYNYGQGKVAIMTGLAPVVNGLIRREDNSRLASRLAYLTGRTLIDEYHLHFSEKTYKDMALDPAFGLPLLGLIAGALLYFLLAHTPLHELTRKASKAVARRSYHDFNQEIIHTVLARPAHLQAGVLAHHRALRKTFPKQQQEIDEAVGSLVRSPHQLQDTDLIRIGNQLIKIHKKLLRQKGQRQ